MNLLWGIGGVIGVLAIAFLLSSNRKAINWRTILIALALQMSFSFIVLRWDAGKAGLKHAADGVQGLINFSYEGIKFVAGDLVNAKGPWGFVFFIQALLPIVFISSLVAILYHFGIMQKFVSVVGGALSKLLGTSKAESLNSVTTVFLGQTEAPILIKPYLARLTNSEFFTIMVSGMTAVAGSVLVGYAAMGIPLEHLLAAAIMAAPSSLLIAKLIMPETEQVDNNVELSTEREDANVIDAAARGASEGMQLVINVAAMLMAFIALIALLNGLLGLIGSLFHIKLSLDLIFGYLLSPFAILIGVSPGEAVQAASFIGQKLAINEFVAYANLGPHMAEFSAKTNLILTFAICGFANFSSIAIQLGVTGTLAPTRRKQIAQLGIKAVIAGTLANFLNAAVAGMMFL
ncbi:NupC/NupG family nucleoside CNT transporter [Bacillus cereus]|uniref:NupC/NupG family nucleoside CNT transporter n=1 Tax=Bacillus mobilis TaxID=2026190 RepID=UPI000BED387A|nr:NupC/NupG family nucleoside CNT transporter [Bacillus mobilis]PDZ06831.1 NupC/NupG family nucleoside CNT transporter [Bacillus cereus]MED0946789.1 NupC/NupG family nucleoside CNT transporter [Bacillus mobilis]MED1001046.1 NupC/NupG family nucleoside CNT transporter [Bacillus mobilis]PFO76202.1 NupC/NupG family nucleoside CNT transporter [Bacillus cereus]PGY31249.1 NupC/NupG family nucleoside CNT transporter [Bacillus cereus]